MLFPGAVAFHLKATYGVPFDVVFERIIVDNDLMIDWPAFIEAARANGWWDFQIYEALIAGLVDAGVDRNMRLGIQARAVRYFLMNKHPEMC